MRVATLPLLLTITCLTSCNSDDYNIKLSKRRAESVKAELSRLGVSGSRVTTQAKGESTPLVSTADGIREPQNRRVEIVYTK